MHRFRAKSQGINLQNSPAPKTQETLQKSMQKASKGQRIIEFLVRLCVSQISEAIHMNSHQHDAKCHLKKGNPNGHAKFGWISPQSLNLHNTL